MANLRGRVSKMEARTGCPVHRGIPLRCAVCDDGARPLDAQALVLADELIDRLATDDDPEVWKGSCWRCGGETACPACLDALADVLEPRVVQLDEESLGLMHYVLTQRFGE